MMWEIIILVSERVSTQKPRKKVVRIIRRHLCILIEIDCDAWEMLMMLAVSFTWLIHYLLQINLIAIRYSHPIVEFEIIVYL